MDIYNVNVSSKNDGFDELFDYLSNLGNFFIYPSNIIVLVTKKKISPLYQGLSFKKIYDINAEINNKTVIKWIESEIAEYNFLKAKEKRQKDIEKATAVMYDIIKDATKIVMEEKKNEENSGKK